MYELDVQVLIRCTGTGRKREQELIQSSHHLHNHLLHVGTSGGRFYQVQQPERKIHQK